MNPNYGYQLYLAERTRTRAEVLAGDARRGRWAAASRRGRGGRGPARRGRGRGIMVHHHGPDGSRRMTMPGRPVEGPHEVPAAPLRRRNHRDDAEESREDRALLASWLEDTIARGVNLQGSYLQPSRNAATIRARDGELLVVDGPFAETKEQIAGFDIIECADLRERSDRGRAPRPGTARSRSGRSRRSDQPL